MLKKLDAYIVGKYLKTFFFVAFLFSLLAVVINFSEKVDNFIEHGIGVKGILFDYYLNFIPFMNGLLWPIYGMITVIFFTSKMASNSEIISAYSGGISFYRVLMPYLGCAILLSGLHFYGNHFLIPESNKKRVRFENEYFRNSRNRTEGKTQNIHLFLSKDTKVYIKNFYTNNNSCIGFSLEQFDEGRLKYELVAKRIVLKEAPNLWTIENYVERFIDKDGQKLKKGVRKDTTINLNIKDFLRERNFKQMMTSPELREFVDDQKSKGSVAYKEFEIELYRRSADAFTLIILTIIGMSIASRKVRGGIGLHLALGGGIGAIYIVLSKFSTSFAAAGDSPMLGVWIPNILFMLICAYLIKTAQK